MYCLFSCVLLRLGSAQPAQLFLRLLCVLAVWVILDQLRQVLATHFAELFRSQSLLLATIESYIQVWILLAFAFRQPHTALARHQQDFFDLREVWITGNDLFTTLQRSNVGFLQSEVILRDFEVVMRVSFEIGITQCRGLRATSNALGRRGWRCHKEHKKNH